MIKKILIPKERMKILLRVKHEIEKKLDVKLTLNDDVTVEGELAVMDAENIIKAIGRGFAPEMAFKLFDEEKTLCIIELPKEEKKLKRIRARIIGTGGRAKRNIERLTNCDISVYGKTVSIIGDYENADIARQAIEKLILGFSHRAVYNFLERAKNSLNQSQNIKVKQENNTDCLYE